MMKSGGEDSSRRTVGSDDSSRRSAVVRSHLDDEPAARSSARRGSTRRGSSSHAPHDDADAPPSGARQLKNELARSLAAAHWHVMMRAAHLLSLNPLVMLVALIGVLALGAGMVQPLATEIRARSGGIWFRASCEVEAYVYAVETHHVGRRINVDSAVHFGGTARTFFCAYNVTVTLADGCDGRTQHMPTTTAAQRVAHAELDHGYFIVDIDHNAELEGDIYVEADDPPALRATAAAAARRPPAGGRELVALPSAAAAAGGGGVGVLDEALQAQQVAAACTAREANLDHLRGNHIAASALVLANGDYCTAPFNSTLEEGEAYCDSMAALWARPRPELGATVECWAFERRVRQGRAHEVRIVLSRTVSNSLLAYCLYAICAALLALRVGYLFVRRWLQLRGHIEPDDAQLPPLEQPWVADGQSARQHRRNAAGRGVGSRRPSDIAVERTRRADATYAPLV